MKPIKILIKENNTLLKESETKSRRLDPQEYRMWLDQALGAGDHMEYLINPETGEMIMKDRRGAIRIDPNGYPYTHIEPISDDFVDSAWARRTGAGTDRVQMTPGRAKAWSPTDVAWFNEADAFTKEAERINGKWASSSWTDYRALKDKFGQLATKIRKTLRKHWRLLKFKAKSLYRGARARVNPLDTVGKERVEVGKAKNRSKKGRERLAHGAHTKEEVKEILEDLNKEIENLKHTPALDADALPDPDVDDDWGMSSWEKEQHNSSKRKQARRRKAQKKAAKLKAQRARRVRALEVYRDLLQNAIDADISHISAIKITSADVPKINALAPNKVTARMRRMKMRMSPGRGAAKITFLGTAAALWMYYDLIKELLEKGARRDQIAKAMGYWTAAHLESMDTAPHVSIASEVDDIILEVEDRYKLAWFRYGRLPIGLKKIAREKGIPFAKPTSEDKRIINARNNVRDKGMFSQILKTLTSGMKGSAFDDPYKPGPEQFKPGAIPRGPKDPGYWSAGRGTGKMEESIDKNCKRSDKIKIKINS